MKMINNFSHRKNVLVLSRSIRYTCCFSKFKWWVRLRSDQFLYLQTLFTTHYITLLRPTIFVKKKKIETHTSSRSTVHSLKLMSPVAEDKIEERKFGSTHRLCHFFGHYLQNLLLLIIYFHFYPDQNNVNEKWYYLATTNLTVFDNLSVPTVKLKA